MGTYDNAYDDYQVAKGESRRAFTYLTLGGARFPICHRCAVGCDEVRF